MVRIALVALIAVLSVGCSKDACPDERVVVIVRHADRDGELLNEKGLERARSLRDLVAEQHGAATAVIYSTHERTRQTVEPIIEAGSVTETEVDPQDFAAIATAVRQGTGPKVVVIAGHSNTVRPILEQFDSEQVAQAAAEWFPCAGELCHTDYDDVWTVTLCGDSATSVSKATYGAPTPNP
jgi:phosphohistidine phosphatase SixA